jgi:hypothetical protein
MGGGRWRGHVDRGLPGQRHKPDFVELKAVAITGAGTALAAYSRTRPDIQRERGAEAMIPYLKAAEGSDDLARDDATGPAWSKPRISWSSRALTEDRADCDLRSVSPQTRSTGMFHMSGALVSLRSVGSVSVPRRSGVN